MLYAILQNYLNIWLLLPTKAQISKKCHKYSTCLCKTCWCSLACGSLVKPPGVCVLLHGLWHMCVAAGAIKICETINNISAQREIATVTHTHAQRVPNLKVLLISRHIRNIIFHFSSLSPSSFFCCSPKSTQTFLSYLFEVALMMSETFWM